jgi:hypothetical protein
MTQLRLTTRCVTPVVGELAKGLLLVTSFRVSTCCAGRRTDAKARNLARWHLETHHHSFHFAKLTNLFSKQQQIINTWFVMYSNLFLAASPLLVAFKNFTPFPNSSTSTNPPRTSLSERPHNPCHNLRSGVGKAFTNGFRPLFRVFPTIILHLRARFRSRYCPHRPIFLGHKLSTTNYS